MDCIFCKIIKGEIPAYKVYEDDKILSFLDVNPHSPGHTLIIPKEHTTDINTIPNDTLLEIMKCARPICELLKNKLGAEGFTILQNNGFVQEVKHFHLHVIPKYKQDVDMSLEEAYEKITHSE